MISGAILEGAEVFISNEGLIKQLPTPLSVHVYRLVWRQLILFAHNFVIYIVILIVFPKQLSWTDLSFIPALALIAINAVWVSLVFGILSTRYRDIGPLLASVVQLLFFMTPIIWTEKSLQGTANAERARIAELNPLYHFLDIVRTPLLRRGPAAVPLGHRARRHRRGVGPGTSGHAQLPFTRRVLGIVTCVWKEPSARSASGAAVSLFRHEPSR